MAGDGGLMDALGDPRLELAGAIRDAFGRIDPTGYDNLKAVFANEPPRERHPDPKRPGVKPDEVDTLTGLSNWSDVRGCGWKAENPATKRLAWFGCRRWGGSWRLSFLLARLQRRLWELDLGMISSTPRPAPAAESVPASTNGSVANSAGKRSRPEVKVEKTTADAVPGGGEVVRRGRGRPPKFSRLAPPVAVNGAGERASGLPAASTVALGASDRTKEEPSDDASSGSRGGETPTPAVTSDATVQTAIVQTPKQEQDATPRPAGASASASDAVGGVASPDAASSTRRRIRSKTPESDSKPKPSTSRRIRTKMSSADSRALADARIPVATKSCSSTASVATMESSSKPRNKFAQRLLRTHSEGLRCRGRGRGRGRPRKHGLPVAKGSSGGNPKAAAGVLAIPTIDFCADPDGDILSVSRAVCDDQGRLVLAHYKSLKAHFAGEVPRERQPDPSRPGIRANEQEGIDPTEYMRIWSDAGGAGWIAQRPSAKRTEQRWFSIRTWGSWRLCFLLARLQRDVWSSSQPPAEQSDEASTAPIVKKEKLLTKGDVAARVQAKANESTKASVATATTTAATPTPASGALVAVKEEPAPLETEGIGLAIQEASSWLAYTPNEVDGKRCLARIWNRGQGGQCEAARPQGFDLCEHHQKQAVSIRGLTCGFVDGPIPASKLEEFHRAAVSARPWFSRKREPENGFASGGVKQESRVETELQPATAAGGDAKRRRGRPSAEAERGKKLSSAIDAALVARRLEPVVDSSGAVMTGKMVAAIALMSEINGRDVGMRHALLCAIRRALEGQPGLGAVFVAANGVPALRPWMEAALPQAQKESKTGGLPPEEHENVMMEGLKLLRYVPVSLVLLRQTGIGRMLTALRCYCVSAQALAGELVAAWRSAVSTELSRESRRQAEAESKDSGPPMPAPVVPEENGVGTDERPVTPSATFRWAKEETDPSTELEASAATSLTASIPLLREPEPQVVDVSDPIEPEATLSSVRTAGQSEPKKKPLLAISAPVDCRDVEVVEIDDEQREEDGCDIRPARFWQDVEDCWESLQREKERIDISDTGIQDKDSSDEEIKRIGIEEVQVVDETGRKANESREEGDGLEVVQEVGPPPSSLELDLELVLEQPPTAPACPVGSPGRAHGVVATATVAAIGASTSGASGAGTGDGCAAAVAGKEVEVNSVPPSAKVPDPPVVSTMTPTPMSSEPQQSVSALPPSSATMPPPPLPASWTVTHPTPQSTGRHSRMPPPTQSAQPATPQCSGLSTPKCVAAPSTPQAPTLSSGAPLTSLQGSKSDARSSSNEDDVAKTLRLLCAVGGSSGREPPPADRKTDKVVEATLRELFILGQVLERSGTSGVAGEKSKVEAPPPDTRAKAPPR
eukprot:TRINITY_DN15315_c0_g1_i2.p1 TRINITY_DN15315_c0_g1~~TRINITY_DN15315_c0_g1_i2.p1  ORF type:complete len:1392 (-),score=259.94 TRINITY_DN15315_c0_g1_i2:84-4208(-)